MTTKCTSIEILRFADGKERKEAWLQLSEECQRAHNTLWSYWLVYHTMNGSADLLHQYIADVKTWDNTKPRGPKPKWPVQAFPKGTDWPYSSQKRAKRKGEEASPPDLQNDLYHLLTEKHPDLSARTCATIVQKWAKDVKKRKAARGVLPAWAAILINKQGMPSFSRPLPIPIAASDLGAKEQVLTKVGREYHLRVAVQRGEDGLIHEDCLLMLHRKKCASVRAIVDRMISGEYTMKGSNIIFSRARNKWFAQIAYEMPPASKPTLVEGRTLYLIPGKCCPWVVLSVDEKGVRDAWRAFGRRHHVANFRRLLLQQRRKRQEASRWGSETKKGRGRSRATQSWTKYSDAWNRFVNGYQQRMVAKLIELCRTRGYSHIVYCRPNETQAKKTYLVNAGNSPNSKMGWQWYQLQSMLANKCQEVGVEFKVKSSDDVQDMRGDDAAKAKRRAGKKTASVS